MRDIILGGLLLPLRLYFQPVAFANEIAALAPGLPRNYNLLRASHKLRDDIFRRGLKRIILQTIIALSWIPLLAAVLSAMGYNVAWRSVAIGLAISLIIGAAFSLIVSLSVGVTVGVAMGIAFGIAFGLSVDLVDGLAVGVAGGIAGALTGSLTVGLAITLAVGLAFDLVFGIAGSTAFGLGIILTITHLHIYPVQFLLDIIGWAITRFYPGLSPTFWQVSAVRWDESVALPLPGLAQLLVTLNRTDPALGQKAVAEVRAHRFQKRVAQIVLVRFAQEELMLVNSLTSMAAFEQELDWLSDQTALPTSLRTMLLRMRDISREIVSVLESDSATNRVRRLTSALNLLESLWRQPGEFGPSLSMWSQIITNALEEARQQKRIHEPIPQVYIKDGTPIRLADRSDTALPFKGRAWLFRQLEDALGGQEGERATYVLYGQRRAGKTSALLQLPRRLGSQMVPAFLDLQSPKLGGANSIAGLLSGIVEAVCEEAQRNRRISLPPIDRDALMNDPFPAFGHWLDKMEDDLGERTLLLCLDEFEELEKAISNGRFDTRILYTIRNIAQHRRRIAMLLSGGHQISELPPHWASALITTTTLTISFLEQDDARNLIMQPVADFPAIYTPEAVNRIIKLTHCQPYLIQLTCALLVEKMNGDHRMPPESFVTKEDVDSVVPVVLARGQSYFIDLWHMQTGGKLARQILSALVKAGGERLDGKALRRIEPDEMMLGEAINTLLRREIIERIDNSYHVVVPLVAAYVRQEVAV